MKLLFSCLTLLTLCFAATAQEATNFANINKNNLNLSANFVVGLTNRYNTTTSTVDLGVTSLYFVVDHLSVGLLTNLTGGSEEDTVFLMGPAVEYFFWQKENITAYTQAYYQKGLTDATISGRLGLKLGTQYFITPSVAAGPYVSYLRVIGRRSADYDRFLFGAAFGIYL